MFTFNIVINGPVDLVKLNESPAHVFIVDLDFSGTTLDTIRLLREQGRIVVAYFSSGTTERRERNDVLGLPAAAIEDLTGEGSTADRWLDVTSAAVRNLMATRVNRAKATGCDAVLWDFTMAAGDSNKFKFTAAALDAYMAFLANTTHAASLAVGVSDLAHNVALAATLFDFAFITRCVGGGGDCVKFEPFINELKPVYNVEYETNATLTSPVPPKHCEVTEPLKIDSILKGTRSFYDFQMLPFIPCSVKDVARDARSLVAAAPPRPVRTAPTPQLFTASGVLPSEPPTASALPLEAIIGIAVGGGALLILLLVVAFVVVRRRDKPHANRTPLPRGDTAVGVLRARPLSETMTYTPMPTAHSTGALSASSLPTLAFPAASGDYLDNQLSIGPYEERPRPAVNQYQDLVAKADF
jgi:hypothetical protein